MSASLPMYDTTSTAAANDRLWRCIRENYGRGPLDLDRQQDPHTLWESTDLVLSQTCGLPYRSGLHLSVQLVGTPDYGVTGCPPGYYNSCILVRTEDSRLHFADFQGTRLARNDVRSQSGWAAILEHAQATFPGFQFDDQILETGSHAASVQAVAEGKADIAAVDAVTWELLSREAPTVDRLRILERTRPTPGLPYITGGDEDADLLFTALQRAIVDLTPEDRDCLLLKDIVKIPTRTYLDVPLP